MFFFIDEIDKKAKDGALVGHEISREGFQRSVLKLIERKLVPINSPYSPVTQIQDMMDRQMKSKSNKQDNMVSTENILFILDKEVQDYLENYAHQNNTPLSNVLKRFLSGASALNYDEFDQAEREKEVISVHKTRETAEKALKKRQRKLGKRVWECYTRIVWVHGPVHKGDSITPDSFNTWAPGEKIPEGDQVPDGD